MLAWKISTTVGSLIILDQILHHPLKVVSDANFPAMLAWKSSTAVGSLSFSQSTFMSSSIVVSDANFPALLAWKSSTTVGSFSFSRSNFTSSIDSSKGCKLSCSIGSEELHYCWVF